MSFAIATPRPSRVGLSRDLSLVGWQIRYEQRSYWRNRSRGLFTFAFPLIFLVIFASLDRGGRLPGHGGIPYDDFLVPGILAYAVITTTFTNLSMTTAILRDEGILKRMQGTPLPRWAYLAARIASTCIVAAVMAVVVIVAGVLLWGVDVSVQSLAGVVATLLLGTAGFTALGIGLTQFIPKAENGPVIVNLIVLPISFISNIWFPTDALPSAVKQIAAVFPIDALARGLEYGFDPRHAGAGFDWPRLAVLGIWLVIGAWLMLRFLRRPQGELV